MKKILFLTLLLTLQACHINGITDDYGKLSKYGKSIVKPVTNFNNLTTEEIYKVNASQIKEEIKKHPKAIVYVFKNGCTSYLCKPLNVYENYAKKYGYKLFLVMTGYGRINETWKQPRTSPLFAIDAEYYQTIYQEKYRQYFENELSGKPREEKEKEYLGSLFFFNNGEFEKVAMELPASESVNNPENKQQIELAN